MAAGRCADTPAVDILNATQQSTERARCRCWWGAYWRHLANAIELSVCGGDATLCQITLITCSSCCCRALLINILVTCKGMCTKLQVSDNNNRFTDLYLGLPGWASTRRNTHPPTILSSWSSSNLYQLLPSTTIHSILPVQIVCLAIFLHNLCPRPFWSTCWSGALHHMFHAFLHPISEYASEWVFSKCRCLNLSEPRRCWYQLVYASHSR